MLNEILDLLHLLAARLVTLLLLDDFGAFLGFGVDNRCRQNLGIGAQLELGEVPSGAGEGAVILRCDDKAGCAGLAGGGFHKQARCKALVQVARNVVGQDEDGRVFGEHYRASICMYFSAALRCLALPYLRHTRSCTVPGMLRCPGLVASASYRLPQD